MDIMENKSEAEDNLSRGTNGDTAHVCVADKTLISKLFTLISFLV